MSRHRKLLIENLVWMFWIFRSDSAWVIWETKKIII
jgi:hypothetical protein